MSGCSARHSTGVRITSRWLTRRLTRCASRLTFRVRGWGVRIRGCTSPPRLAQRGSRSTRTADPSLIGSTWRRGRSPRYRCPLTRIDWPRAMTGFGSPPLAPGPCSRSIQPRTHSSASRLRQERHSSGPSPRMTPRSGLPPSMPDAGATIPSLHVVRVDAQTRAVTAFALPAITIAAGDGQLWAQVYDVNRNYRRAPKSSPRLTPRPRRSSARSRFRSTRRSATRAADRRSPSLRATSGRMTATASCGPRPRAPEAMNAVPLGASAVPHGDGLALRGYASASQSVTEFGAASTMRAGVEGHHGLGDPGVFPFQVDVHRARRR